MEWIKRMGLAIEYIEENLDKEISYAESARIPRYGLQSKKEREN